MCRVEAVSLVDFVDAVVTGLGEDDVDALELKMSQLTSFLVVYKNSGTYRVKSRAVLRMLNDLDRRVVACFHACILRQRYLRQTHGARVCAVGRANNLESWYHWEGHVLGSVVGSIVAKAQVDVHEGDLVALEPARLERNGTAFCRPVGPVVRSADTTAYEALSVSILSRVQESTRLLTWIVPLHAERVLLVVLQIVASPAGVCDNDM